MDYNLAEFDKLVEEGMLRKVENQDLILYNYTDKCVYDRCWNEYTRVARGIIFEKRTGKLIAKPFPKFFNLGEMLESCIANLPDGQYQVSEKVDGSLGIVYFYKGEWHVATRGSLSSVQAVKAKELLGKYNTKQMFHEFTYLVEIVYPENKIVVNYGIEEKLVLLGMINVVTGVENLNIGSESELLGMPRAERYYHSIEKMIELQSSLSKDQEGFVVRFSNGLRVKIKGQEYMRIHKMISEMSPLSFWESMVNGVVNREYLAQLPEEYRKDFEPIVAELERQYARTISEINQDTHQFSGLDMTLQENKRSVGMLVQGNNNLLHPHAVFPVLLKNETALNKYVMKHIRPDGNNLRVL